MKRRDWRIGVLVTVYEADGGVGGAAGIKSEGMQAADAMMETIRTVVGTELKNGFMSDASWLTWLATLFLVFCLDRKKKTRDRIGEGRKLTAPPRGFAILASAVAPVRPLSVNHMSLYLVGAASTKGCARPVIIWPTITTSKIPPFAVVPAYLIQFPTKRRPEAARMDGLGPRCKR